MGTIREQLIRKIHPLPREVWKVLDKYVVMHEQDRDDKKERPVLVVSSKNLITSKSIVVNIVPLSTANAPNELIFPIGSYEHCEADFKPDKKSCAILQLYQPLHIDHFVKKCGTIDANSYDAIVSTICFKIIGSGDFDLSL